MRARCVRHGARHAPRVHVKRVSLPPVGGDTDTGHACPSTALRSKRVARHTFESQGAAGGMGGWRKAWPSRARVQKGAEVGHGRTR
jgi:hypothetical protein